MKKHVLKFSAFLLLSSLLLSACKKKHNDDPAASNDSAQQRIAAQDQSNYSNASNQSSEEADQISSGSSSTERIAGSGISITISGAVYDTSNAPDGKFYINYSGQSINSITRVGVDTLTILGGGKWHVAGTKIVSKFNYTATFENGRRLKMEGTDTLTNISGGNWLSLMAGSSTKISQTGTTQVTFEDGTQKTWHHSREKVRTYTNGIITVTVTGTGKNGADTDIETWGVNRYGETFHAKTITPIVWSYHTSSSSNTCTHWKDAISGACYCKGTNSGLTITYGVTSAGSANTSPFDTCPYGYKLDWMANGKVEESIIAY